jgi:hypothetical protein
MEKSKRLNSQKRKEPKIEWSEAVLGRPTCTVDIYMSAIQGKRISAAAAERAYYLGTAFRILTACILHARTRARERDYMGFFLYI